MSFKEQAKNLLKARLDECPEMVVVKQFKQMIIDKLTTPPADPCDLIDLMFDTPIDDNDIKCIKNCIKSELGVDVIVGNYQLRFDPSVLLN